MRGDRKKLVRESIHLFKGGCAAGRAPANVSSKVFQTLHLAVVTRLLPHIPRGDKALMARAPPKETRAAKAARLRD